MAVLPSGVPGRLTFQRHPPTLATVSRSLTFLLGKAASDGWQQTFYCPLKSFLSRSLPSGALNTLASLILSPVGR